MSAEFQRQAMENFPPGGSADGRPSYEMFVKGPLPALGVIFQHWEGHTVPDYNVPSIRMADLYHTPFFPPMVVLARLVVDGADDYIELLDLDVDWQFYDNDE